MLQQLVLAIRLLQKGVGGTMLEQRILNVNIHKEKKAVASVSQSSTRAAAATRPFSAGRNLRLFERHNRNEDTGDVFLYRTLIFTLGNNKQARVRRTAGPR